MEGVTMTEVLAVMYRLDVYIYDYLVKRNLQASAKAFLNEGKVSSDPVGTYFFSPCFLDKKFPLLPTISYWDWALSDEVELPVRSSRH